ncbi:tetratricopeptide repeat protein [Parvibaculum lavamentivorans]|nr:tetratricopeptide repeat protein [Parvibaculum lavamentivorans]
MSAKHALLSASEPSKMTDKTAQLIQTGMLAHRRGEFSDAVRLYTKVLKKVPQELTALSLLADAQLNLGKNTRALETIRRALTIKPDMPSGWMVQGSAQRRMGHFDSAIASLEKALELNPDYVDALMTLAGTLRDAGKLDAAIDAYEDLIDMSPEHSKAYYNLGNTLMADGQHDEAIIAYKEAARLDPDYPAAQINLAGAFHANDQLDEAIEAADKALASDPSSRSAKVNRGNILKSLTRLDKAEKQYRDLITEDPKDADAHDLLGTVLQGQARFDEAITSYRTAIGLNPANALYLGDLSTSLLATGELVEGWKLYEARFGETEGYVHHRKIGKAVWRGEPLTGKTLLVWREQGVGDDIRFASCLGDLLTRAVAEGGRVIIETDPRLITLYARSFPTAIIRAAGEMAEDETIDFDIATGSLPSLFRKSVSDFPNLNAYLKPKQTQVGIFRDEIDALGAGLKIGIAWRSQNMASSRRRFYTELSEWQALFAQKNIQLVNLQYGNATAEIEDVNTRLNANIHVVGGLDLMNDLDGAAALTSAMDIVISAGTSVGDMAGALGVPTYMYGAHQHPMCLGTDNFPWYPSVTWIGHRWNEPLQQSVDKIVDLALEAANAQK